MHPGFFHGVSAAQAYHAAQVAQNRQAQFMMNRAFNPWGVGMMYSGGTHHAAGGMGHLATGGPHVGFHASGMGQVGGGHR
jgi:hypothetical protein